MIRARANVAITECRPSLTLTTGHNSEIGTELTSVSTANRQKQEALQELKRTPEDAILSQTVSTNPILTVSQNLTSVAPILLVPSSYLLRLNTQKAEDTMAIKRNFTNNNNSTDGSSFSDDDDSSLDEEPCSRKMLRADVAVDYSRSSYSSSPTTSDKQQPVKTGPRRHTGPRKPRAYEKLTPEEEERRRVRRERNKHAAAKCRQKRVDLTNTLLAETEKLQSEQLKLQNEIKEFQREKDELEFILEAHRLHCGVGKSTNGISVGFKPEIKTDDEVVVEDEETVSTTVLVSTKSTVSRPTTLSTSLINPLSSTTTPSNQVAGIAITTPTAGLNVFTLGLESMMDGHTGLTPITGLPVAFAGISTPLVITGISGSQLLLAGGGSTQQVLHEETVSTPCNGDAAVSELI